MKTIEEYKKEFGTVKFDGVEYILTEQAAMDNYGTDGAVRYYASGLNPITGDIVKVAWDTTAEWDKINSDCLQHESISQRINDLHYQTDEELAELEAEIVSIESDYNGSSPIMPNDEADACDWDHPASVEIVD